MMIWWLILLAPIFGWLRGTKEGMIMSLKTDKTNLGWDGVRDHEWFDYYHLIGMFKEVGLILLSIGNLVFWLKHSNIQVILMVSLELVLIWDFYEWAYPFTRFGEWFKVREHITFIDLVHWHAPSKTMHLFRLGLITLLSCFLGGTL